MEPNEIFLGWGQRFSGPGIGGFSITFTQKDHFCGDGLCAPILKLINVGDWMALDVNALSQEAAHNAKSVGVSEPGPCVHPDSRKICADTTDYNNDVRSNLCGMLAVGKAYARFGKRFGRCDPIGN